MLFISFHYLQKMYLDINAYIYNDNSCIVVYFGMQFHW